MSRSGLVSRTIVENLEKRVLLAQINVADFGAVPNDGRDDFAAIEAAFRASSQGDTIVFQKGTYDVSRHLHFNSNRTYQGAGERDTRLKFNVGDMSWGTKIWPDSNNVTVENFVFDGGGLAMSEGTVKNITIRDNEFVNVRPGPFNHNGPAIFAGVRNEGLTITGNYIHGHEKYGLILFGSDALTIRDNTFENLTQGMHILDPGKNISVSFNRFIGMVRMGVEMQRHGPRTAEDVLIEGNVITDWRRPFNDSFGLSIVPDGSSNVRVINNYIQGVPSDWNGQWHDRTNGPQGKRMGYGIEYGSKSGEISGNIIGGAFANHISVSGGGGLHSGIIPVKNNKLYHSPLWIDWIAPQSHTNNGFGFHDENNIKDRNYHGMSSAPSNVGAGFVSEHRAGDDSPAIPNPDPEPTESSEQPGSPPIQHGSQFDWLSDLQWHRARNGWGDIEIDRSNGEQAKGDGLALSIGGEKFDKGLGVHAGSEIVYRIDNKYKSFTSKIGVDDEVGDVGSVVFEIWVDGRKIFDSGVMTGKMGAKDVEVDLSGATELRLVVTNAGDDPHNDHANWADAKLSLA